MGIYNRVRVLVMDGSLEVRNSESARAKYDEVFEPIGGRYCGYMAHSYDGPRPAHFYMIDEPSDALLAQLLLWKERGTYPLKLFREYKGHDNCELSFNSIVGDVAAVLQRDFIEDEPRDSDSNKVARCWSGVQVLALAARHGQD